MKVVITGACGMLAGHIIPLLDRRGHDVVLTNFPEQQPKPFQSDTPHPLLGSSRPVRLFDITEESITHEQILALRPDWIINCAAFTAVDLAETAAQASFAVNALGPFYLARAAKECGAKFAHISSDYVFGGYDESHRGIPFVETDEVKPCGVYGQSKALGDESVLSCYPEGALILRTSWLHGLYGPNFVDTIVKAARERDELRVVDDQFGSPTWAGWLADITVRMIEQNMTGLFHSSCEGDISWRDFAAAIVRGAGLQTKVNGQTTAELNRPAPRPAYSTLSKSKLHAVLSRSELDWREGLAHHLSARGLGSVEQITERIHGN